MNESFEFALHALLVDVACLANPSKWPAESVASARKCVRAKLMIMHQRVCEGAPIDAAKVAAALSEGLAALAEDAKAKPYTSGPAGA